MGHVIVIGAGPAGLASALSLHQAGHQVTLLERHPTSRPAGTILNLWPPPLKALGLLGVDTEDFGAPCVTIFQSVTQRQRARVDLPQDVIDTYNGGFIGLLRPELYERLHAALPDGIIQFNAEVTSFDQDVDEVRVQLANGRTLTADLLVGADGIHSMVRSTLWGSEPVREQDLHVVAGYVVEPDVDAPRGLCVLTHDRVTQGTYSSIRYHGQDGFQWWVLAKQPADEPFDTNLKEWAASRTSRFPAPVPQLIATTPEDQIIRWQIRDRKPLEQWAKGRATLVGDAAHPTSPYAAYGAGMSIEDGYFLGRRLAGVDLTDATALQHALAAFEAPRRPHTAFNSQNAYRIGRLFHHLPAVARPLRGLMLDRTPFLQKTVGEATPKEIIGQLDEIEATERTFRQTAAER